MSRKDRNTKVSILQVDRYKPIPGLDAFDHVPVRQHLEREPVQGPVQESQIQDWSKTTAFLGYDEVRAVKPLPHLGWRERLDCILFQEDSNLLAQDMSVPSCHRSLTINGATVERVSSTKFLGVHITEDLSWTNNTAALAKKAQQRLYFLRKLRRARAPAPIMCTFYRGTMESILTSCITVWYGTCNASCRKSLQRIVRAAEKIVGVSLPYLQDIYSTRLTRKALCIAGDPTHPTHSFFSLLPSGRRPEPAPAQH